MKRNFPIWLPCLLACILISWSAGGKEIARTTGEIHEGESVEAGQSTPCGATARDARRACRWDSYADYFISLGKAENISDDEERAEAKAEAKEELQEALEECAAQLGARLELCDELEEFRYDPEIDPADFIVGSLNQYYPLIPNVTLIYEGETEDGTEEVVVTVLDETIEILGVTCRIVQDTVFLDGEVIEDTMDYYAQHVDGSVWYFGENSFEFEDGEIVNNDGSWKSGVDGAKPGPIMLADPMIGDAYRQEFLLGEAEDAGRILALGVTVTIDFDTFVNCLKTADFTPLEPDTLEHKFYAPDVGTILEVDTESGERLELIDIIGP